MYVLDSYAPTEAIVSRKFTQLSEIRETTAIKYLRELAKKYAPGARIANVPSSGELSGKFLSGQQFLEVPIQKVAIPRTVLDEATRLRILIRDITGKVYN